MNAPQGRLESEFRRRGILTASDAADALGVSQPTVSRLFSVMGRQQLLRIGRGRSTLYALRRSVRELGSEWPIYTLNETGTPTLAGRLYALEGGRWYVEQEEPWNALRGSDFRHGLYPGLPWFIQDLRPQGFLGRCFARNYASQLGAPSDPRRWRDDDIAGALLRFGEDLPGAFVLGESALTTVQTRMTDGIETIVASSRHTDYPARAVSMLAGERPGSSAAGEQPKFTACVCDAPGVYRHVLVKFSGRGDRSEDERWADLLLAEHTANTVLSEDGIACAATNIIQAGGRTFLESTRFDRVGAHGRRGLVSLEALDSAFFGQIDAPWRKAADRLRADRWISDQDAERLSLLWWFGTLIGNTDMHYGNVSFFLVPTRPLSLAPTYDMTPMHYRPDVEGRFSDSPFTPPPPMPECLELWSRAAGLAHRFWSRMASAPLASPSFRRLSEQNADVVSEYRNRFGD